MDQMTLDKLYAIKMGKKSQFLSSLIFNSLTALTCTLLCSYPFWYPVLCSYMKHFLFTLLPHIWFSFFNPKCLFVVANIIVAFLLGESKLLNSHSGSASDIYAEYVERKKCIKEVSKNQENKVEKKLKSSIPEESLTELQACYNVEAKRVPTEAHCEEKTILEINADSDDDVEDKKNDGDREFEIPPEELHKRAEEFIARVNKQRWLEARSLVSCNA